MADESADQVRGGKLFGTCRPRALPWAILFRPDGASVGRRPTLQVIPDRHRERSGHCRCKLHVPSMTVPSGSRRLLFFELRGGYFDGWGTIGADAEGGHKKLCCARTAETAGCCGPENLNLDCQWVSVVVVEVAGTAGTAGVEVVVLVVVVGVVQPVSDTRAATAKHERMNFFISIFFVWFIVLQTQDGIIARASLSGITLSGPGLNGGVSRTGR